jgi:HEAT repeat protein
MNRFAKLLGVLVLLAAFSTLAASSNNYAGMSNEQYDAAVANLLIGLQSDNPGLSKSCAFMLGELKAGTAVVPLMGVLRSDKPEDCRIIAALALCRIGDARGVYAVKQAVTFDESTGVQQKCAWFYDQFVHPGSYEFVTMGAAVASR